HTVSVMRDGRLVTTAKIKDVTKKDLADWIVGDHVSDSQEDLEEMARPREFGSCVLEVKTRGDGQYLEALSFSAHAGEIIGIAGLDGSGKDELLMNMAGLLQSEDIQLVLNEQPTTLPKTPSKALDLGIVYLPKDREGMATIHGLSVKDNLLITSYPKLKSKYGLVDNNAANDLVQTLLNRL